MTFLNHQKQLYPEKQPRQLQRQSDTRWACRQSAITAICFTFDAVIATLSEVTNGKDASKATEARGILLQVQSFQFLLCLIIFDRLLTCIKGLSDVLQSVQLNLDKAAELVVGTIKTIESFRSDEEWMKLLSYAKNVADTHDISTHILTANSSRQRRKVMPQ